MITESFAVGCEAVYFHNGVVVIDLAGLSESEKDAKGRPKRTLRHRVVMTPTCMLETLESMRATAQKLVEVGFLKKADAGGAPVPPAAGGEGEGGESVQ